MNDLVSKIRTIEAEIARNAPTKKVLAVTTSLAMAQLAAFFVLMRPSPSARTPAAPCGGSSARARGGSGRCGTGARN